MTNLINETFEGTGYAVLSGTTAIGGGSTLDADYSTANSLSPSGWGQQCLRAVSVAPNLQARKNHQFTDVAGNLYLRDELIVISSTLAPNTESYLFSCWDNAFALNLFHFKLRYDPPDTKIQFILNNNGTTQVTSFIAASMTRYVLEVNYNFTALTYEWRANGVTQVSGSLTGAGRPTALGFIAVGSDLFVSATQAHEVTHDNVAVGNLGWIGGSKDPGFVTADRVRETTTTTGTGNITLAGAVSGFQAFAAIPGIGYGDLVAYAIMGTTEWEVGIGTYLYGGFLQRTTVLASSTGAALVSFSAGTKDVFCDLPAEQGLLPLARHTQVTDVLVPSKSSTYINDHYELIAGKAVELGSGAAMEIG